jgi:hypothetical protein
MSDKKKYFRRVSLRYLEAKKASKRRTFDEFCTTFELKRNYTIGLMNRGSKRQRKPTGWLRIDVLHASRRLSAGARRRRHRLDVDKKRLVLVLVPLTPSALRV